MMKRFSVRNIWQPSTAKAVAVLLNAAGLQIPNETIQAVCTAGLVLWTVYESLSNGERGEV